MRKRLESKVTPAGFLHLLKRHSLSSEPCPPGVEERKWRGDTGEFNLRRHPAADVQKAGGKGWFIAQRVTEAWKWLRSSEVSTK